ncbi:hypothetical protein BJX62DRAFT_240891 [Aspergillus germanicus]
MIFFKATTLLTLLATSTAVLATPFDKRYPLTCNGLSRHVPVNEAQAYVNFICNKGTAACSVPGENVEFCSSGSAKIYGSNPNRKPNPTSHCSDVARGAQAIIDSCRQGNTVSGSNAAWGNGDIIITIAR